MKSHIDLEISKPVLISILKEHVDSEANFVFPKSHKDLIGTVHQDGFEIMVANTYGTKPIIFGQIVEHDLGITILFHTRTPVPARIAYIIMDVVALLLMTAVAITGHVIPAILGGCLFLGFGYFIYSSSYYSELSEAIHIIRTLAYKEKLSMLTDNTN